MKTCAVVLKMERGNTKGLILSDVGRQLLFAEAEEPRLTANQIRDYCLGHRLDVTSLRLSIDVDERNEQEVRGVAQAVRKVIKRIVRERRRCA